MIVNLNTIVPDKLVCPAGKRRIEYVDKGGTGKTCHEKLGRTGDIELDEARRRAKIQRAEITLCKDPRAEKKSRKSVITLDQAVTEYVFPYLKPRLRTAKKYEDMYNLRISSLYGSSPITEIQREHLLSLHPVIA